MKTEYQKCMDGEFFTADSELLQWLSGIHAR